ncbi:MAG: hypothetical protein GXY63_03725, partial [Spirochaetales bacterium]|nr:hypothetical protein [Spirochaetales bacterium]
MSGAIAPFIPQVSTLSQRIGIRRQTIITYSSALKVLAKPEKILRDYTNRMAVLGRPLLHSRACGRR